MQKILVTGGAGFVGSHMAVGLATHGGHRKIIAFDNLKRRGSELNLPRLRQHGVEFVHGDVRNAEDLDAVGKVDLILECSAEPSVLAGLESGSQYLVNTNLFGTVNCLELARKCGAGMIFFSTSRVYPVKRLNSLQFREEATRLVLDDTQTVEGASKDGISEMFPLDGARSLYGATKLCSEYLLAEYVESFGISAVVNRCGVIAGPWQMGKVDQGFIALWVASHFFGGKLSYIGYGGEGKQVRDVLHVNDLFRLVLHEIDHLKQLSGRTFNVGGRGGGQRIVAGIDRCVSGSHRRICPRQGGAPGAAWRYLPLHHRQHGRDPSHGMAPAEVDCRDR